VENLELTAITPALNDSARSEPQVRASCLVCGQNGLIPSVSISAAPALCNALHPTPEAARAAPIGRIELMYCPSCRHTFNAAYEDAAIEYSSAYENSLHYSERFVQFVDELASRLATTYALKGKTIVDVGCGKGEFLARLCSASGAAGVGFDKSFESARCDVPAGVRFVSDWFDQRYSDVRADMVTCRHVLEHIADPVRFLRNLRCHPAIKRGSVMYVEVPNALYSFRDLGIWDLIYEHVSYFTPTSLCHALNAAGFDILDCGTSFGEQFAYVEASPGRGSCTSIPPGPEIERLVHAFAAAYTKKVDHWRDYVGSGALGSSVVWGAGSKGVMFVNATVRQGGICALVDANPHKHGRFVPGTGTPVVAPGSLAKAKLRSIIVMNPLYEREISRAAAALEFDGEVVVA
jgi:2-polyprenyl-3-methyl-5-hydroxy-6-metoxy-1,4-benzoquinol methylase